MTNSEAKQAFIRQVPIFWENPRRNEHEGSKFKRISAITWRIRSDGTVIVQLELEDKIGNSVIIANPKDVTEAI